MDKAFKEILPTHEWTLHRKKGLQEMRPYVPGEDLTGVSVNKEDTPEPGGWIARNEKNHADQWYIAKQFYADKYDPASLAATGGEGREPSQDALDAGLAQLPKGVTSLQLLGCWNAISRSMNENESRSPAAPQVGEP